MRLALFSLFFLSCTAASHPPVLRPLEPLDSAAADQLRQTCLALSGPVETPRRLVHSIEARLPGGGGTVLMGVTQADCAAGVIRSVLLTLEGMVLFDGETGPAVYNEMAGKKDIRIHRALPPFDSPGLAAGLLSDAALIACPPHRPPDAVGSGDQGRHICRFRKSRVTLDLIPEADGWTLREYADGRLRRTLRSAAGITELVARDAGYALDLDLISAESVKETAP
ncbi:MAG: hypothetical protein CSB33_01320 [Desulfobacterales bacterium]|nr:MAG: hypothetical protein CSB33_01320 [Desulfobacterales bacterium]